MQREGQPRKIPCKQRRHHKKSEGKFPDVPPTLHVAMPEGAIYHGSKPIYTPSRIEPIHPHRVQRKRGRFGGVSTETRSRQSKSSRRDVARARQSS